MQNEYRFPFPFQQDVYQYSNNLRSLDPPISIQITDEYRDEIYYKRTLLQDYPNRCYHSGSSTIAAQWEVLSHLLHELADVYPQQFELSKVGDRWTFHNKILGESTDFVYGEITTLGIEPLDFVGRQVQEDLILMSQRDQELILEAGQLCFPGNWSLMFDSGMYFMDIHRPVPGLIEGGLGAKIQQFLVRIETGKPWTRLNWSLNVGRRLDTSPETFDVWGPLRYTVTPENVGTLVHLRVEEQNLVRMPGSNSLLFTIHTYLMAMEDLIKNREWLERTYHIIQSLAPEIAEYKGLQLYRNMLEDYLYGKLDCCEEGART